MLNKLNKLTKKTLYIDIPKHVQYTAFHVTETS